MSGEIHVNRRQVHIIDHFITESLAQSIAVSYEQIKEIKQSISSLKLSGDAFRLMAISCAESFLKNGHRDDVTQLKDLATAYSAAAMALVNGADLSKDWVLQKVGIPISSNSSAPASEAVLEED